MRQDKASFKKGDIFYDEKSEEYYMLLSFDIDTLYPQYTVMYIANFESYEYSHVTIDPDFYMHGNQ